VTAPTTTPTSGKVAQRSPGTSEPGEQSDKSLGELVAAATKDLSLLVTQEVALAKAELKKEVAHAGKGAGMLGGAGFLGLFALIFLSIALAYAISWFGIGLGWGFFIVGMLYLVGAAVLALLGKKQISKVGPPEKTIATVKDDVAWAKHPTRP
jgi:hypothetical protein